MEKLIYLDNGATSYPKPDEVYTFMNSFYRGFGVNPGRSGYDLCMETGALVDTTRKMLADFFNGNDPNRLCFSYNSTDALNLVIFGMLKRGDHAITTTIEHNSVLRPLYHLSKFNGVEVDHIAFDKNGFVDPDDIKQKIKANTRLVIVNHASNVIGTVQTVDEIGRICREAGVPFAIDASQTAGKIPIDIDKSNIDVVAFTGHKSLLGPTGIGGLSLAERSCEMVDYKAGERECRVREQLAAYREHLLSVHAPEDPVPPRLAHWLLQLELAAWSHPRVLKRLVAMRLAVIEDPEAAAVRERV